MLDVNQLNHLTLYLVKGPGIYHMLDVNQLNHLTLYLKVREYITCWM